MTAFTLCAYRRLLANYAAYSGHVLLIYINVHVAQSLVESWRTAPLRTALSVNGRLV